MSISTVLVGPLTTTFTPPSECSTILLSEFDLAGLTGFAGHWGYQCQVGEASLVPKPTCFPESHLSNWPTEYDRSSADILVYSPGYVCPAGWTSACSISRGQGDKEPTASGTRGIFSGTQIMWNAIQPGQAIVGCYECGSANAHSCLSPVSAGESVSGFSSSGSNCDMVTITSTAKDSFDFTQITAPQINLVQETGSSGSDNTTGVGTSDDRGNKLSTGAKIGIGISVPLAVAFLSLICFFLIRRRRKRKAAQGSHVATTTTETKPELDAAAPPISAPTQQTSELGGNAISEVDATNLETAYDHRGLLQSRSYLPAELDGAQIGSPK
ncbi:transmembrane alpha-helix domain-containing protein [Sarocladium implicatum]|nr:transmembrane alpha-helix domain-containing protein [Sarocladium implicatum]